MQFKYPELLWALFLLLIPIVIHLFQLRRFKKTPFTNVKFLKKVVSESRRSNTLKKWVLLLTRLFLLTAFILAFAQPFFASKTAFEEKETVVYLDDSFSMELKADGTTLMEDAIQELIRAIPENEQFSLFTNIRTFKNVVLANIQNELLALSHTPEQLNLNQIYLKGKTIFNSEGATQKNLIIISDFQQRMAKASQDTTETVRTHLVQLSNDEPKNIAIDSAYLNKEIAGNTVLTALLSSSSNTDDIPVSLFNGDKLIAKTSATFNEGKKATVNFTLPQKEVIDGRLEITDTGLYYDNQLYFNIEEKEKIKVLAVGPENSDYLKRIYSEDEFLFSNFTLRNLNYSDLSSQNLIILNGLKSIPNSLVTSIKTFTAGGGSLAIVPASDSALESYNQLVSNYFSTSFGQKITNDQNITNISFSHPLYRDVFEKNVTNFQYPMVSQYHKVKTSAPTALSFQNREPFLFGSEKIFFFTASLSTENSNFKNSPLIVPTFYNIGSNSLKLPRLYNVLGNTFSIDVPVSLSNDNILKMYKDEYEFIPRQRSLSNRVSLTFDKNLREDGLYTISENQKSVKKISFNHNREESDLAYSDMNGLKATSKSTSIANLFDTIEKNNSVTELWKWFVILALLFLMLEILIQKFVK